MSFVRRLAFSTAAVALLATANLASVQAHDERGRVDVGDELDDLRAATGQYHSLATAQREGYELLRDAASIACIDQPGVGGMGIHYVNGTLVGDGAIDAARPEAVIYEAGANGRMRLVAVEYVVFQAVWDATNPTQPALFGHDFELIEAGNRYGLPAFYALHAWVWKTNSSGTFADWNPQVTC